MPGQRLACTPERVHNPVMEQSPEILRDLLLWIGAVTAIGIGMLVILMQLRRAPQAPPRKRRLLVFSALAALLVLLAVYWQAGQLEPPDAADVAEQSGDGRDSDLWQRLAGYFAKQPSDARAWVLLARRQAEAERYAEAAQAYEKALALPSRVAKDPAIWCEYADALGMTQHGKLAGKPRQLIDRALALQPDHPKALEMAGSAEYEQGDYASALDYWRPLLAQLKPGSQMHRELADAIARTERLAASALPARQASSAKVQ